MNELFTSNNSTLEALETISSPEAIQTISVLFWILLIWTFVWKGVALWKAARNNSKPWFIALLVVNTMGLLEILYIFYFSKKDKKKESEMSKEELEIKDKTKEEILEESRNKEN
ncbi:DUF5652 family protein [Candidatus Pacebacteria bacterium]|nr:DUF5652 family protein [Candidatus Paceibacterota bacterium]